MSHHHHRSELYAELLDCFPGMFPPAYDWRGQDKSANALGSFLFGIRCSSTRFFSPENAIGPPPNRVSAFISDNPEISNPEDVKNQLGLLEYQGKTLTMGYIMFLFAAEAFVLSFLFGIALFMRGGFT